MGFPPVTWGSTAHRLNTGPWVKHVGHDRTKEPREVCGIEEKCYDKVQTVEESLHEMGFSTRPRDFAADIKPTKPAFPLKVIELNEGVQMECIRLHKKILFYPIKLSCSALGEASGC